MHDQPHPGNPGDKHPARNAGTGHLGHLRIQRLRGTLRRIWVATRHRPNQYGRLARAYEHALSDHEIRIAGGDLSNGDAAADVRPEGNGGGSADVPIAGPERPGPYLLYRHLGPDAEAYALPIDAQTDANLRHFRDKRLSHEGK